jgi:hypothetical protein
VVVLIACTAYGDLMIFVLGGVLLFHVMGGEPDEWQGKGGYQSDGKASRGRQVSIHGTMSKKYDIKNV